MFATFLFKLATAQVYESQQKGTSYLRPDEITFSLEAEQTGMPVSRIHFQTTLGNINWLQLTWVDGSKRSVGARLDVDDDENQNNQLNDIIARVGSYSPAEDILDDDELNAIVSKAVTQDISWEIENSRDCFIAASDDSLFTLSNWQMQTKGSAFPG